MEKCLGIVVGATAMGISKRPSLLMLSDPMPDEKKKPKTDLDLAAEGATNIYNAGKGAFGFLKKKLTGPTAEEKASKMAENLKVEVAALENQKKNLTEAEELRKKKAQLEQEIQAAKGDANSYR